MYIGLPSYLTTPQRPFRPRDLITNRFGDGHVLRLNGAAIAALGDGNGCSSLNLSDIVSASQATSGNRPTYKTVSSRDVVRFTAANSQYFATTLAGIDVDKGWSVVMLADIRTDGRFFSISDSALTESSVNSIWLQAGGNGLGVGDAAHSTMYYSTFSDYTDGSSGLALFSGRFSGVEITNWLNGSKRSGTAADGTKLSDGSLRGSSGSPSGAASQALQIGRRLSSGSALYPDADIVDLVMVHGALTDEEIQWIEGVLAWEHSATSLLPSGHPWKSVQPNNADSVQHIWGGAVITRSEAAATKFLGSPSLTKATSGNLYFMHDFFGSDAGTATGGAIYESLDDGKAWRQVASIPALFWGKLWQHTDGAFYILAADREFGNLVIGKSSDACRTWSWTTLSSSGGPLIAAGSGTTSPNYSKAPCHPLYHDGHIFFACENLDPVEFPNGFKTFILWADAASDLMDRANWFASNQLALGSHSYASDTGFWESTVIVDDAGQMWSVSRITGSDVFNKAVFIPIAWDGVSASLPNWSASYIKDFPGGHTKFDLVKHDGYFYAIVNDDPDSTQRRNRVVMTRMSSADLSVPNFTSYKVLVDNDDVEASTGMSDSDSRAYHGFQYASFEIDADDVVRVGYRIAWSGAHTFHDSNLMGFTEFGL